MIIAPIDPHEQLLGYDSILRCSLGSVLVRQDLSDDNDAQLWKLNDANNQLLRFILFGSFYRAQSEGGARKWLKIACRCFPALALARV